MIEPDGKDWTWVLDRRCPDCGFDAAGLDRTRLPRAIEDNAVLWQMVLGTEDAAVRPAPHIWSALEYACHVRDVNRLFATRLRAMLGEDDPLFDNWDQDATAVEDDYGSHDPAAVAADVAGAATEVAGVYAAVSGEEWQRRGRRSNGSEFSVDTLGRYHLHDLVHHAHDVSHLTRRLTVDAYDEHASEYADGSRELHRPDWLDAYADRLGGAGRILEIGSAQGRDAAALEARGFEVRRTDIARGFVELLRSEGHEADRLDPLTDDLTDAAGGPYDGIWASASLLHVRREDLPVVLQRLAAVTRPGGVLWMSLKEGDGARFSTHGRVPAPRHFTFWREAPLRNALEAAGWGSVDVESVSGDEPWLVTTAVRHGQDS